MAAKIAIPNVEGFVHAWALYDQVQISSKTLGLRSNLKSIGGRLGVSLEGG